MYGGSVNRRDAEESLPGLDTLVADLGTLLVAQGLRMGVAESCTGGLVAHTLTNVAGSSAWFEGAVVAYDNRVKQALLGVSGQVLHTYGAVSAQCVEAMAVGVARLLHVPVAVAVSGIAGPGGGSADKPVGTVWMGWWLKGAVWSRMYTFCGDREQIKVQGVRAVLEELRDALTKNGAP
ncbi:CinA family protein [Desulfovibrionales bacterium]